MPSEFTLATVRLTPVNESEQTGQPISSNPVDETSFTDKADFKSRSRKIRFNDNVQVHRYDVLSDEDDCESQDRAENDSPLICLDTIFEDRHSDSLYDSTSESEVDDEIDVRRGRKAKKAFKVKFGIIPC